MHSHLLQKMSVFVLLCLVSQKKIFFFMYSLLNVQSTISITITCKSRWKPLVDISVYLLTLYNIYSTYSQLVKLWYVKTQTAVRWQYGQYIFSFVNYLVLTYLCIWNQKSKLGTYRIMQCNVWKHFIIKYLCKHTIALQFNAKLPSSYYQPKIGEKIHLNKL